MEFKLGFRRYREFPLIVIIRVWCYKQIKKTDENQDGRKGGAHSRRGIQWDVDPRKGSTLKKLRSHVGPNWWGAFSPKRNNNNNNNFSVVGDRESYFYCSSIILYTNLAFNPVPYEVNCEMCKDCKTVFFFLCNFNIYPCVFHIDSQYVFIE